MSMHTPGPWQYRPHKYDDWGWVRGGTADDEGSFPLVACARSGSFEATDYAKHRAEKTDPFEANARLIAEAPVLLAELKNLLDCIDLAARNGETILPFAGYGQIHLEKAKAIVAKAEGRA